MNVSEFVWQRLAEWGLRRVYGYPGDGVGGLDVALEKAKARIEYVQVRHEEMAAFMASAHAKFTGEVGLCYATSGPDAIHLLNGLYDAKMDHVPVVALLGQQTRSAIGAPRLPDNAIVTADSGSVANWYARDLKMRRGMKGSLSGGLASLGAGTPYAVAAKMAYPDRTVIACMGDGAMQMNGLNEMITIAKYWKQWADPRLIVLVLNNRDLNQVTWEERIQLGAGKTESTQSIPDFPYHRYAELIGLKGIFVDNPDRVGAAWDEALSADRPVILEAYTDPNVPPLPPHITLKDAKNFMTMMGSEPELGSVLTNSAKELLASVLPGKG